MWFWKKKNNNIQATEKAHGQPEMDKGSPREGQHTLGVDTAGHVQPACAGEERGGDAEMHGSR